MRKFIPIILIKIIFTCILAGNLNAQSNTFPSTGNVGIGTATPTERLHFEGTYGRWLLPSTGRRLEMHTTDGSINHYPWLGFYDHNGIRGAFFGNGIPGEYLDLVLENGNDFSIRGGNVGIGTLTPQSLFHVNGQAFVNSFIVNDQSLFTIGKEQLLSTDATPIFEGLTSKGQGIFQHNTNRTTIYDYTGTAPEWTWQSYKKGGTELWRLIGDSSNNHIEWWDSSANRVLKLIDGGGLISNGDVIASESAIIADFVGIGKAALSTPASQIGLTLSRYYSGTTVSRRWDIRLTLNDDLLIRDNTGSTDVVTFLKGGGLTSRGNVLVEGTTKTEEVIVTEDVGADFVFEDNYQLPDLTDVETFIQLNRHLPEIPSAEQMKKEGVKVGNLQMKLLQKIEELTLYLIEFKKENETLKNELEEVKEKLEKLKKEK